jgi:hypothetical protein
MSAKRPATTGTVVDLLVWALKSMLMNQLFAGYLFPVIVRIASH